MKTYYLQQCTVSPLADRRQILCRLEGTGQNPRRQSIRYEEFVSLPLCEHESLPETIRRAVFASPHMWRVSLSKNLAEFDGKFYQPVRDSA